MHDKHLHHENHIQPLESPLEYAKFAGVIIGIVALAVLLTVWRGWGLMEFMANFMGVFFLTFGAFKLVNLEMFVLTYRGYDILAKRFTLWAWVFPFVELVLGLGYLLLGNNSWLNVATIAITGVASIGVIKELRRKSVMKCACLGTVIRLPLSKISFVEDFAMLVMAALMIVSSTI